MEKYRSYSLLSHQVNQGVNIHFVLWKENVQIEKSENSYISSREKRNGERRNGESRRKMENFIELSPNFINLFSKLIE